MKSIRIKKGFLTERQLHGAAERLRKAFGKLPRIGKSFWKHDDVNLVELYDDCRSDQEFIDYWTMSHRRYMWKYHPETAVMLYPKK
jgi:hypothetical protein